MHTGTEPDDVDFAFLNSLKVSWVHLTGNETAVCGFFHRLQDQEKSDLLLQYKTLSSRAELLETNVQQTTGEASTYKRAILQKEQAKYHVFSQNLG